MSTKGIVVPAGGGIHLPMNAPGRFAALKLLTGETGGSIMMFEEMVPAGTKSWFHLHHDSDEVAFILEGEFAFKIGDDVSRGGAGTCVFFPRKVPHAWKNVGDGPGRALFLYTPGSAGAYVEGMLTQPAGGRSEAERDALLKQHRWELVGPNPL